jgi:hypothetical protein
MRKLYTLLLFAIINLSVAAQQPIQKVLYHEFGKSDLTQISQGEFDQIVQQVQRMDVKAILIRSYADKIGTSEYNKQLSQQRSFFVMQMFQKQLPQHISYEVDYFGEDSLLTSNNWEQDKNRRTEIIISCNTTNKVIQVTKLTPYIEDVSEQRYQIDLNDTVTVIANEGTFIKFAPGTFLNKKDEIARGRATLLIREYYKPPDILLSGMQSVSDSGLLQTGGMIKVFIVQNNDTMKNETRLPVLLRMPAPNNVTSQMNLFTADHSDSTLWKDTRRSFTQILSYWNFPTSTKKLQDFIVYEMNVEALQIGKPKTEEIYFKNSLKLRQTVYEFGGKKNVITKHYPVIKYSKCTITKTDSATLAVKLFQKFRRRGSREYKVNTFDTAFAVKRFRAAYEINTGGLAYINCDRFINAPQVTDFYVKTPGFQDAQMLVYFKDINAFMTAEYKNGTYQVKKVPTGEFVYLIAVGKKGNDLYYGKEPFTISKKATPNVAMQKVKYEEMKKMFDLLGYKKVE